MTTENLSQINWELFPITKKWLDMMDEEERLHLELIRNLNELLKDSKPLDPEFNKILNENLLELF